MTLKLFFLVRLLTEDFNVSINRFRKAAILWNGGFLFTRKNNKIPEKK